MDSLPPVERFLLFSTAFVLDLLDFSVDKSPADSVVTGQDLDGPFSTSLPFFDAVSVVLCPFFAAFGPFSWLPSIGGGREELLVVEVDMGAVDVMEGDELLLSRTLARFSISALKFSMSI